MLTHLDETETIDVAKRGRPAAGQDPAKRSQIIAGARRVFIEMGFDAASMNDITRAAGVSKGTIYVYFASKEELFEALIEEERCAIFNDLYDVFEHGKGVRDTLVQFGTALATKITSETVMRAQRSVIGICERIPELGARFYESGPKRGHAKIVSFLKRAVDDGHLAIPDVDAAAYQLTELCMAGLFRQRLFGYRPDAPRADEIKTVVNAGVDVFLSAYSRRPAATN